MVSTPGKTTSHAFDALIAMPTAGQSASDAAVGLDAVDVASGPRPSFATVVAAFLAIAVAQVGIVVVAHTIFDLNGVRTVLLGLIVGPAVLYGIVAAWDQRELAAAGRRAATPWVWALIPPAYLALRRRASPGSGGPLGAVGWSIAQAAVIIAFAGFAVAIAVAAPAPSADAAPTASPTTTEQVAEVVEQRWADAGISGTADCLGPAALEPGDEVKCTGVYGGTRLVFSASVTAPDAEGSTVTIASWAEVPAP